MDKRFIQANYEALYTLGLTLFYLLAWLLAAYWSDNTQGMTGFPQWFERACLGVPILFIFLCWLMIKKLFRNVSFEDSNGAQ